MAQETLFHAFFTFYFFVFTVYRSYYMGFVDASGEEVQKLQEGVAMRRIRYTLGTPVVIGAFAYVLNPSWMAWSQWEGMPVGLRWLGVIFMGAACAIYGWTHHHLGKNFTDTVFVRKASQIVTDGPYAYVRHPMYVSGILAALGCFTLAANWFLGGLGMILMLVIMYWRTPIEERKLLEWHGEEFRLYMERTGRFFPQF